MTKSYYSHLLTMFVIHGFLFLGTWQVIRTQEVHKFIPQNTQHSIQIKVASESPVTVATPVKKVEKVQKQVSKTTVPTPKVTTENTPVETNTAPTDINVKFTVMDIYKAELRATIEKNKYYPTMSRRLGQTGTVVIAFTLLEDGNIVDVRIEKPSQYERLNVSALDAVKKVERFKPIPKEVGEVRMDIKVPVKFVTI